MIQPGTPSELFTGQLSTRRVMPSNPAYTDHSLAIDALREGATEHDVLMYICADLLEAHDNKQITLSHSEWAGAIDLIETFVRELLDDALWTIWFDPKSKNYDTN